MNEQRQKTELKKAQMANEWESRTKPQETQQYPAQRIMKEWYEGNFDWRNPRNQYKQTLMEIRRPRSRSRPRSGSKSRSRPRSRSKSRSRPRRSGTPIPRRRSHSRSRSRSRPRRSIYAITRAQQKAIENAQRRGTVINGESNGFRLQVIFSTIHRVDWITETTAQRCSITGVVFQIDHYLEDTYMDHRFRQQTRNPIDIKIGEDPNQNNLYITTDDR